MFSERKGHWLNALVRHRATNEKGKQLRWAIKGKW